MPSLTECYQACADITSSSNHPYGRALSLFPKHVRPHLQALYAFAHIAEHIRKQPTHLAHRQLEALREQTHAAYHESRSGLPHLTALAHTLRHFDLEIKKLHTYIDHTAKSAKTKKIETYRALQTHIDQTSGVLGQLSSEMIVSRSQKSLFAQGVAFARAHHLFNVLTTVHKEAAERGIIHLPQRDLKKFGYKLKHLKEGIINESWQELCECYLNKIENHLRKAEQEHLSYAPSTQFALQATQARIRAMVHIVRNHNYDVISKPTRLSWLQETKLLLPLQMKAQMATIKS